MSGAAPQTPLLTLSVHVPPRQTCHLRTQHPETAESIVLKDLSWDADHPWDDGKGSPRDALDLSVDSKHRLVPGKTSFDIEPTKTVYVEVGNCSDVPLEVAFEVWGAP